MLTKEERKAIQEQERQYKKQEKEARKKRKRHTSKTAHEKSENTHQKPSRKNKQADSSIPKLTLSVFPIRDYQDGFFLTDDNRIIDLFQIQGRSYYDSSDDEVDALVSDYTKMLRRYSADMKLIGMNYPTNTKLQQAFLAYKLKQPELEQYEDLLTEKLETLRTLERTTTDREAFLMLFARDKNQYEILCHILEKVTAFSIKPISREKKENIIFQLNNMNKCVKI